jgi:hypothetical protein
MRATALVELQGTALGALMDPMETLKRVLAAMREDPKGLIKAPPPPSSQPSPEQTTADAKMLEAQNKGKKIEVDAAELQQKGALQAADQKADIQKDTLDIAKEIIIHKADQAKAAHSQKLDTVKTAHDQTMDKAKHGLDVGVAAHKSLLDTHKAILDTHNALSANESGEENGKSKTGNASE